MQINANKLNVETVKTDLNNLFSKKNNEIIDINDIDALNQIKGEILGKKGYITSLFSKMKEIENSQKKAFGKLLNEYRNKFDTLIKDKISEINRNKEIEQLKKSAIDVSLPGYNIQTGHFHPLTSILDKIVDIFHKMGFQIADGPDIETDYYNFEALNFPMNHPARDMQDTLYLKDGTLLRTHTSPVQIRVMEKTPPRLKIIIPGRVFRCDADLSHSPMFHQVEGLMVGPDVTFSHLKGSLINFCRLMFGENTAVRFRPSFFPFTEPSAEIDIECIFCGGTGCRICKKSGWIEILGAGMVDPNLYKYVNYDSEEISGFAFGIGIERIAMLKYQINDIRLFFENSLAFLNQF